MELEKRRVLRVQSRICVGGPALNTINLSIYLDPDRYQSLLVGGRLLPEEKCLAGKARDRGVAVHLVDEMGRSLSWREDLKALWKLIRLIRYYKPHVVHTHTAKAGALGRFAAWLCRVPVRVHTFHGHVFHGYFSPSVSRLAVWVERILAVLSSHIVAISPRQYDDIVKRYRVSPASKTSVIRLGFELDQFVHAESGRFRADLGVGPEVRLVGLAARLAPVKHPSLFLRAISAWRRLTTLDDPEKVRFVVIGDGELRPELEALCKELNLEDLVLFAGWRDDMPHVYADLDLNVLVSKNEGTPVSLIEGLARGVPALSTDVGGVRDFTDDETARIVPADVSAEALGQVLFELLDEDGLPRLSEERARQIREQYSAKRLAADMERLYEKLFSR